MCVFLLNVYIYIYSSIKKRFCEKQKLAFHHEELKILENRGFFHKATGHIEPDTVRKFSST